MPLVSFDTKVSKEPVTWHGLNNAFLNPIKPAINKSVTNLGQYFESTGIIIIITPTNIYLFKLNNRNTRKRCEICSKLTIKTTARRPWRRSGVFIVNFKYIPHLFLLFLFLTLNKQMLARIMGRKFILYYSFLYYAYISNGGG